MKPPKRNIIYAILIITIIAIIIYSNILITTDDKTNEKEKNENTSIPNLEYAFEVTQDMNTYAYTFSVQVGEKSDILTTDEVSILFYVGTMKIQDEPTPISELKTNKTFHYYNYIEPHPPSLPPPYPTINLTINIRYSDNDFDGKFNEGDEITVYILNSKQDDYYNLTEGKIAFFTSNNELGYFATKGIGVPDDEGGADESEI